MNEIDSSSDSGSIANVRADHAASSTDVPSRFSASQQSTARGDEVNDMHSRAYVVVSSTEDSDIESVDVEAPSGSADPTRRFETRPQAHSSSLMETFQTEAGRMEDNMLQMVKQMGTLRRKSELGIANEYNNWTLKEKQLQEKISALERENDRIVADFNRQLETERKMRKDLSNELGQILQVLEASTNREEVEEDVNNGNNEEIEEDNQQPNAMSVDDASGERPAEVGNVNNVMPTGPTKRLRAQRARKVFRNHEMWTPVPRRNRLSAKMVFHELDSTKKGFYCVCGKQTVSQQSIMEHVKRYDPASCAFQCPKCPKRFYRFNELKYHKQQVHQMSKNAGVGCRACGASFTEFAELMRHRYKEHRSKPGAVEEGGRVQTLEAGGGSSKPTVPKRGRGRPRKLQQGFPTIPKQGRGRPRKWKARRELQQGSGQATKPKKGRATRGRARKWKASRELHQGGASSSPTQAPMKKRGRPRKIMGSHLKGQHVNEAKTTDPIHADSTPGANESLEQSDALGMENSNVKGD